jgi:SagB-type dehydrogenase family enzyme
LWQDTLGEAQVTFVLSAVFERTQKKYRDRSIRYIYMEAGHISQNISLQAISLGLGSVCVGAFYDKQVNDLIGLDGNKESVIYLQAVGTL